MRSSQGKKLITKKVAIERQRLNESDKPSFFKDQYDTIIEKNKADWEKEWVGMPEFIQENLKPCFQLLVSFQTPEAIKEFEKLIEQKITNKTKSLWYPKVKRNDLKHLAYVSKDSEIEE